MEGLVEDQINKCTVCLVGTIDKIYIDGPCELLIRRYIDKLLAEHFFYKEIVLQI